MPKSSFAHFVYLKLGGHVYLGRRGRDTKFVFHTDLFLDTCTEKTGVLIHAFTIAFPAWNENRPYLKQEKTDGMYPVGTGVTLGLPGGHWADDSQGYAPCFPWGGREAGKSRPEAAYLCCHNGLALWASIANHPHSPNAAILAQ